MNPFKIIMIIAIFAIIAIGTVSAFLDGIDRQQAYNQRNALEKCQEGWQWYCKQLAKAHVEVDHE